MILFNNRCAIRFLIFLFLLFCGSLTANGQEKEKQLEDKKFEEWQKQQAEALKKQQEAFEEFRDKRDKAFAEYLKDQWQKMQVFQGLKRDERPKPRKIKPAEPVPRKDLKFDKAKTIKEVPLPKVPIRREPDFKNKPKPQDIKNGGVLNFDFLGSQLTLDYDESVKVNLGNKIDEETISNVWVELGQANYEDILFQVQYFKKEMRLNDWGYGCLLNQITEGLFPVSQNNRTLFIWFILLKSGYDAKVGFDNNHIYLLLPSKNDVYGTSYITIENRKFYLLSFNGQVKTIDKLFTYEGSYPDANDSIDLRIETSPNIKMAAADKQMSFSYKDKEYSLSVQFNKNLVRFYEYYPQTDLKIYFDAPISPDANYFLLRALKPIVEGRTQSDAVNVLLRFVQTAFRYSTDLDQFGREKYFFTEETLFYPYSDCEDRSIFFANLVSSLLGLEIIGLDYPGHIATAVRFTDDINGEYVDHDNKKYIICDPTYANADFGMLIPTVKKLKPKVIPIRFNAKRAYSYDLVR